MVPNNLFKQIMESNLMKFLIVISIFLIGPVTKCANQERISQDMRFFQIPLVNLITPLKFLENQINAFKKKLKLIYPGTLWCGDGDIADKNDELGLFKATDGCCRQHDLCNDSITAGQTKYGLLNNGLFTRSHCSCDEKFYNCLKSADSVLSYKIGFTYFSLLGPYCFKLDYVHKKCQQTTLGRCMKYEVDLSSNQKYQWFSSPFF